MHPNISVRPGHWYFNRERQLRVWCRSVVGDLVYVAGHPGALAADDDVWREDFFRDAFVPCEDHSVSHVLGSCPKSCPTCFHPTIERAVHRAIRMVDKEREARDQYLHELRQLAAEKRRRR